MATYEQITRLRAIIADAEALIQELKQPVLTREGWSTVQPNGELPRVTDPRYPRHGCAWVPMESRALVEGWMQFSSVETMALRHRRSEGAIRSQLQHLLNTVSTRTIVDMLVPPEQLEKMS